jgi:DNA-binding NarL/FixJ family response regulator
MTSSGPGALAGRRVLIVEDEVLMAMELEDLMESEGAVVVGSAGSVARGRDLIDQGQPEVAILDLNLAGEDSTPLAAALTDRDIPFVVVTGYDDSWLLEAGLAAAPRTQKPVNHAILVRLLEQLLR